MAPLLRATLSPNPTTLLPAGPGAGAFLAQPSVDRTVLAASVAPISSAQAAPSSVDPTDMPPMQRFTTQREASADARSGAYGTALPVTSATPLSAISHAKAPVAASPALGAAVPAPSPGGFAPASGASVGVGVSAATFLALAALLLLAAPRALRRLQRAGTSWRLAQFSLIPARPG
ncbi:MAG TPA: hypothetical protein VIJ83_02550 [Solirubrobacteraceae bacterium]